jgi:beta-N-acetylhexosaminidase
VAIAAALALTLLLGFLLLGGDDDGRQAPPPGLSGGVPAGVRGLLAGLSSEEKVDQVLALGFEGTDSGSPVFAELRERQLGAVFVDARNWLDASQGSALVAELKEAGGSGGRISPLILAAQEGGPGRAFADLPPAVPQVAIGDFGDSQRARRWAREAAAALAGAGFDLNLFPVADAAPLASPISERAFSEDPGVVAQMTLAAVIGCREAGLACAPAHFPGLGAASGDTDAGPATVGQTRSGLLSRDLVPFGVAIRAGAPAVVVSHSFYAAYDPVTPASQTPAIVTGLLRKRLGFEGAAVTDDLSAGAVRALGPVRDAAVASLLAGADLLLIEGPAEVQHASRRALLAAVASGEIPRARLDEAAGRVLALKRRLGLL